MSTEVKELAIVKRIMKALKLDEAGKIGKFLRQEIKTFNEAIDGLKLKLQILELKRKQAVAESDRNIEDAKEAVEAAYDNITLENVANNAAMSSFSSQYWDGINSAEGKLKRLEEQSKLDKERYDKDVAEIQEQIDKYQARIKKISKEA